MWLPTAVSENAHIKIQSPARQFAQAGSERLKDTKAKGSVVTEVSGQVV